MNIVKVTKGTALNSEIEIHGSKSYTNRALLISALATSPSTLLHASLSDDSKALIDALKKIGYDIKVSTTTIIISPKVNTSKISTLINVGPAGTTLRFLTAFFAFRPDCEILLTGSERLKKRPIGDLVEALKVIGADIEYLDTPNCAPLRIKGVVPPKSAEVSINGNVSSQYISALLMIAPIIDGDMVINIEGELTSSSYVQMTIQAMNCFGVKVENENNRRFKVSGGQACIKVQITL
jgi:3-phosphoshikimate 1-carboxyvinyltransferase